MSIDPLLPAWLMILVMAVAGGSALMTYRRMSLPALLRSVALVVIAVFLLNPVHREPAERSEPPLIHLVLDRSASMSVNDVAGQTRWAAGLAAMETLQQSLKESYRVAIANLDTHVYVGEPTAPKNDDTSFSDLTKLIEQQPSAIMVLSDGGDRGDAAPDDALAAAGIPVYTVAIGENSSTTNVAVRLDAASPTAFPGQSITLDAVIQATGSAIGRMGEIILSTAEGQEIERRSLTLAAQQQQQFTVELGSKAGEQAWRVALSPITGEATTADNTSVAVVQIVDRPLRIAVIEAQPYWDTSFAVRSWRRDRQLSVRTVFAVGNRRYRSGDGIFDPLTSESLRSIDVVVIGSQTEQVIDQSAAAALLEFVTNGGGLLLLGINDSGSGGELSALDPVLRRQGRQTQVAPVLTDNGRALALLPSDGRALSTVASGLVAGLRPRTEILVGVEQQPLVVRRRHGAGQVAAVNAEGLWRWSLGNENETDVAARFWRQLIKSISKNGQSPMQADRPRYRSGQEASISVSGEEMVSVTKPNGQRLAVPVAPSEGGLRVARLRLDEVGSYIFEQAGRTMTIPVEADVREVTDIARRDDRLARLAGRTGGQMVSLADAQALAERLTRRADLRVKEPVVTPLITTGWWLLIVVGILTGEWWIRRRHYGVI
jgi:hypothetical protein